MTAAFEPTQQTPEQQAAALELEWAADPRWDGVTRDYTAADVVRLRGRVSEEHTLARRGAEKLWKQLTEEHKTGGYTNALGAFTGDQAVQQVRAGLKAIYLSGWQVAADGNLAGQTYPDQSLYPANSVPAVVRRINNALLRAGPDRVRRGQPDREDWLAPIVADAEAGFGGPLNAYELTQSHDPGRRRRRPLGGPARQREEVRPPRRQGAGADAAAHPHAERGPARRRRRRRADGHHRPHRRRSPPTCSRATSTSATRSSRPASAPAAPGGLLPGAATGSTPSSPAASPSRRTPTCSGSRRASPTSSWPGRSPKRSTPSSPASCSPTTARRRSTGSATSTTPDRDVPARARRPGLQVPVHHPGRLPRPEPLDVRPRPRLRRARHERLRRAAGGRVRRRGPRLHRHQAPARGRHRLLRPTSPPRSTRTARPSPSWDPPRRGSSTDLRRRQLRQRTEHSAACIPHCRLRRYPSQRGGNGAPFTHASGASDPPSPAHVANRRRTRSS